MSLEEKFQLQYEVGFPILCKLCSINKDHLILILKDIFQYDEKILEILNNNPRVTKTITNDEPEEILIYYYSKISITYFGIKYHPEHGSPNMLLRFTKFFNINAI